MALNRSSDERPTAAPALTIDTTAHARRTLLLIGGELDAITARQLTDAVAATLSDPAPDLIELDIAAVTFLDSAGIRCLLICLNAAQDANCRLVLRDASPPVHRVLQITGLLDMFGLPA